MNSKLPLILTSASVATLIGATNVYAAPVGNTMDYTQDITITGLNSPAFDGNGAGTGTGVFDDSGTLTVSSEVLTNLPVLGPPGVVTASTVYQGSISGNTWTFSGTSQSTFISCTGNATLCLNVAIGPEAPSTGGAIFSLDILTGGTWTTSSTIALQAQLDVVHTLSPSPVPLPAAAWLFGSALLGLAGVSRKRRA